MRQVDELLNECDLMEKETSIKAHRLKIVNIVFNLMIILFGSIIGVVSAISDNTYKYWITLVLGFFISVMKIISSVFRLESKALGNMQISIKMRQFIRKLRKLQRRSLPESKIEEALDRLGKEFDELRLSIFTDGTLKRVNSIVRRSPHSSSETTQTIDIDNAV
jgi:hypothetical protein